MLNDARLDGIIESLSQIAGCLSTFPYPMIVHHATNLLDLLQLNCHIGD
jgi:hypothetical protein